VTVVLVLVVAVALVLFGVEILRWTLRPAARRLRVIRKIGGRR